MIFEILGCIVLLIILIIARFLGGSRSYVGGNHTLETPKEVKNICPAGLQPYKNGCWTVEEIKAIDIVTRNTDEVQPKLVIDDKIPSIPYRSHNKYTLNNVINKCVLRDEKRRSALSAVIFLSKLSVAGDNVLWVKPRSEEVFKFVQGLFPSLLFVVFDPDKTVDQSIFSNALLFVDKGANMKNQMQIVSQVKPKAFMLNFHVDKFSEKFTYLDGEIWYLPWGAKNKTSAKLVGNYAPDSKKTYSKSLHEGQMYYLNNILRVWKPFRKNIFTNSINGLDCCADCAMEIFIWKEYAKKMETPPLPAVIKNMNALSALYPLRTGYHGLLKNDTPEDKIMKLSSISIRNSDPKDEKQVEILDTVQVQYF